MNYTKELLKEFENLPKENVVEISKKLPYIRYQFENGYGLLVSNKYITNIYKNYVETEEKPYRVNVIKYDDKGNYYNDPYTKVTEVVVNKETNKIAYDTQISKQSADDVNNLIEIVKGYEKAKILSAEELKEKTKDFFNTILDISKEENKTLMYFLKGYQKENEIVLQRLREMFKNIYKDEVVNVSSKDFNRNMINVFKEKGIENYQDYFSLKEKFDDKKINEILKNEAKFEKEVFKEIDKFLIKNDDKVILPKNEKITVFLFGNEPFNDDKIAEKYNKELNKNIKKLIDKAKTELNFSNEDIIKMYDLEEKLPEILIFTNSGIAYSSYFTKEIDEQAKKEFIDIIERNNIENYNDVKELAKISDYTMCYVNSNKEIVNYIGYDDYTKDIVDKLYNGIFTERYKSIAENLKNDLVQLSRNNIENPYFEKKKYEKFEKKLDERIEILDNKSKEKSKEFEEKKATDIEKEL